MSRDPQILLPVSGSNTDIHKVEAIQQTMCQRFSADNLIWDMSLKYVRSERGCSCDHHHLMDYPWEGWLSDIVVVKRTILCLSRREMDGGEFFYIQGHKNIKMASGCVVERPPSSLPSGEKIVWFRYPSFKKRTLGNKNNLGGWGRKICLRSMACPLVRGAWNCGKRGTHRQSMTVVWHRDRHPDLSSSFV